MRNGRGLGSKGQASIEYLLMVAFGVVLSVQIAKFFNDVFRDGLERLETNVERDVKTGQRFPH